MFRRSAFTICGHTHATLLMKNNVNPGIVSERVGHVNIGITLDHYSHVSQATQGEAAEGLEALLDNAEQDDDGSSLGNAL